jgi:hypothetical protein
VAADPTPPLIPRPGSSSNPPRRGTSKTRTAPCHRGRFETTKRFETPPRDGGGRVDLRTEGFVLCAVIAGGCLLTMVGAAMMVSVVAGDRGCALSGDIEPPSCAQDSQIQTSPQYVAGDELVLGGMVPVLAVPAGFLIAMIRDPRVRIPQLALAGTTAGGLTLLVIADWLDTEAQALSARIAHTCGSAYLCEAVQSGAYLQMIGLAQVIATCAVAGTVLALILAARARLTGRGVALPVEIAAERSVPSDGPGVDSPVGPSPPGFHPLRNQPRGPGVRTGVGAVQRRVHRSAHFVQCVRRSERRRSGPAPSQRAVRDHDAPEHSPPDPILSLGPRRCVAGTRGGGRTRRA